MLQKLWCGPCSSSSPPEPATGSRPFYYTERSVLCQTMKEPISQACSSSICPGQRRLQCYVSDLGVHLHWRGLKAASIGLVTPFIFLKCPFVTVMSDYLHLSWLQLTEGAQQRTSHSDVCSACTACLKQWNLSVKWLRGCGTALNQWLQTSCTLRGPEQPGSQMIKSACLAHGLFFIPFQFFMAPH